METIGLRRATVARKCIAPEQAPYGFESDPEYRKARHRWANQVKCLQQLRSKFAALDAQDRAALQPILTRTGCWEPLAAA